MNEADDFNIWKQKQSQLPGALQARGTILKRGARVCKAAMITDFGDKETGELSKQELSFKTVQRRIDGPGYDFDGSSRDWACQDDEIEKLRFFLNENTGESARYQVIDTTSSLGNLIRLLSSNSSGTTDLIEALRDRNDLADVLRALTRTSEGLAIAEGALLAERRSMVAALRQMVENPETTESDLQPILERAPWIFGGRFVEVADRRNLIPLDQHDIPLVEADGTLHIVELKGPYIPRLVANLRNHRQVGNEVHEATSQAINYLRGLDEMGPTLSTTYRDELGVEYDMRRVFATVVIGHPIHANERDTRAIEQTIRTYNAHLSRVEVVTYKALLDAADRALTFESAALARRNSYATSTRTAKPGLPVQTSSRVDEPPF